MCKLLYLRETAIHEYQTAIYWTPMQTGRSVVESLGNIQNGILHYLKVGLAAVLPSLFFWK